MSAMFLLLQFCFFFFLVEVTLVAIFSGSQNGTRVSLSLHPLAAFLDATILPRCLIHAHHFLLYSQELIRLTGIRHLSDYLLLTVQNQPTSPEQEKEQIKY